jgi:TPR repeat protein
MDLMDRGARFFQAGDVAAAGLLFNRAARAGDPTVALAAESTFDPAMLKEHGVLGITSDLEEARNWCEIADKLGSPKRSGPAKDA